CASCGDRDPAGAEWGLDFFFERARREGEVRVALHPGECIAGGFVVEAEARLLDVRPLFVNCTDRAIRLAAEVRAVVAGEVVLCPVEEGEAERAVCRLILHDASEDGAWERVARGVPRATQERDRERLADAEEAGDEIRAAEERGQRL